METFLCPKQHDGLPKAQRMTLQWHWEHLLEDSGTAGDSPDLTTDAKAPDLPAEHFALPAPRLRTDGLRAQTLPSAPVIDNWEGTQLLGIVWRQVVKRDQWRKQARRNALAHRRHRAQQIVDTARVFGGQQQHTLFPNDWCTHSQELRTQTAAPWINWTTAFTS